jgi:CheY-like chemotaxis protein
MTLDLIVRLPKMVKAVERKRKEFDVVLMDLQMPVMNVKAALALEIQ